MAPNEWVILAYEGVPAHRDLPIILPHTYTDYAPPRHCSDNPGRHLVSGNSKTYGNRNETKVLKISLRGTQQLLEALRRNIDSVTAAKCAKGYHFVQTYLPRC